MDLQLLPWLLIACSVENMQKWSKLIQGYCRPAPNGINKKLMRLIHPFIKKCWWLKIRTYIIPCIATYAWTIVHSINAASFLLDLTTANAWKAQKMVRKRTLEDQQANPTSGVDACFQSMTHLAWYWLKQPFDLYLSRQRCCLKWWHHAAQLWIPICEGRPRFLWRGCMRHLFLLKLPGSQVCCSSLSHVPCTNIITLCP